MGAARAASIILRKEIRAELRTRELLQTTVTFVIIVVVLFSFAFEPSAAEARRYGPGLLWIALLFAGSLMLNPSFAKEQANDTIYALRLAPVSPFSIYLGKMLANLFFLAITEAVLLPVFALLYNVSLWPVLGRIIIVLILGSFGIAVTGTVFSAVATQARMREVLLPLLLLPVLVPLLIASVEATAELLANPPILDRTWIAVLVAFDVIFFATAWMLSDYLLEE
jgi:heme exporter protein B